MNLWIRLIWTLLTVPFRPKLDPLGTSVRRFIVWPNDLDLNLHMNNGRYLTVMDLGRFDLTFRTGLGSLMLKRRWQPIAGAARIRFHRGLGLFQRYEIHTRVLAWDEKWFYLEQRFLRGGDLYAEAFVKALFKGAQGAVPPPEIAALLGLSPEPPNPAPEVS